MAPDRAFELSSDTSPESTPKSSHQAEKLTNKHEIILIESGENTPISKSTKPRAPKKKTHTPKDDALDALEDVHEDTKAKPAASLVSSLPLVFPDKVQRLKALVECDGDSIDLSGDVGAVGRIIVSNASSGNHELFLDLKGTIYKSTIVPSRTFCIVSVGQSEAKIEAVMNDFIRLEAKSNLFEAETMIEGTLDGFSFDSDEEGEKASKAFLQQGDPNNDNEVQGNKRGRGKTEKSMGTPSKKKKASAKTPKKAARKSQVAKRTRKSKK
ncbi:DNA-binding protein BIN4 isoform X2 [Phalaenopsis equestris]|uniref:DNA-binding protein BIN4 isoform X2 n=1 Tax=Phalaenopsis equestris TaxID=78828 RepID=UPI0009E2ACB4|nr:DNA-binding protein BIN4 isoform X2 [Phalaenopsis equestris]